MAVFAGPKIVDDGLVLYLDAANEKSYTGSGTTWTDLSGFGNNGTLVNGVGYNSDNLGSLVFDYANDYVAVNHSNAFNFLNQFTVSVFAFPNYQNSSFRTIITKGKRTSFTPSSFLIRHGRSVDNNNDIRGQIRTTSGSFTVAYIPPSNFDGHWHNYTLSFDGSNGFLYIDSMFVNAVSVSGTLTNNTNDLTIGRGDVSDIAEYWDGNISNVQIYNRALTAQEIKQNFEALRGRFGI
jgi:hypothetical protein